MFTHVIVWLESLIGRAWQDVRYSLRTLRRSPGFSLMAVLILGLGIGASTAAFSIVNAVFFKPLAVSEPDRLVYVYSITERGQRHTSFGVASVRFFDGHYDKAFSGVTAHWRRSVALGAEGESGFVLGELVMANYFDVLGVEPMHGRTFLPQEDDPANTSLSVVISHDLWMRRLKGDPDIIGKEVRLDDRMFSVIGVMRPEFAGLSDPWAPSRFWVTAAQMDPGWLAGSHSMGTVARLNPGIELDQAQAIVDVQGVQMQRELLRATPSRTWRPTKQIVVPASSVSNPFFPDEWLIEPRLLSAIGIVVAIVLLIAATNVAGVLAARSVTRGQEVAVRQALGAGTLQLVRQLLTESVVVAIAGGAFGLLLARLIVDAYQAFAPSRFSVDVTFDGRVALFTLAVCVGAGLLVGLAPALQARKVNVVAALAGGAGAGGSRRVRRRLRHAILMPQIALSIVLLVVAGVHLRSLVGIETADVGYLVEDVVTMRVDHWDGPRRFTESKLTREQRAERDRTFYKALFNSVGTVEADGGVAITSALPPGSMTMPGRFISESGFLAGDADRARADAMRVSPGYFKAMGMTVLRGRDFDARDAMTTPHVAIVSEALAARLWPAGNALGQSLAWHFPDQKAQPWWLRVIGVVNETTPVLQDIGERPMLYLNLAQTWEHYSLLVVAVDRSDPAGLIQRLRAAVEGADHFAEVQQIQSMSQVVAEILYPRRAAVAILLASGLVGLILASIGIYGVISYSVAQRLREIGIRATLGANRRDILSLVLREATMVTLAGAVPGVWLGLLALKVTSNVVGAVPAFDLATFLVVPILTMAVILAASYAPARRASRLDPMEVLREG